MVAAWIIAHHLQSRRKKVVLFVVDKVHLAVQQKKALEERIYGARVHEVTGTGSSSKKLAVVSSTDFGDQELSQSMHEGSIDVVVTTAGYIECTMKGQVKITDFSLLVIDECHHTSKQHPFAKLMFHYLKEKQNGSENLPQVVGLTASPGAGGSSDMEKIRDNLIKLCAYLDSTGGIKTVKDHKSELDRHTNKPTHEIITNDARPAKDPFLQLIGQTMRDIEKEFLAAHSHLLSDRMTLQYLQQLKELQKVETTKKDEMNALNVLISLNKGLMIYMDLEKEDAMKHFKEERNFLPKGEVVSSTQQKLHTLYNELLQQLHSIHCNTNPLLLKLESIIREEMPQKTESRAVVIVETQLQALSICKWLGEREALKKFVIPMPVVGQQKEDGMTKAQQVNSISSLKEGHANVLVATSIVEEGMDIPKCNLVIRYQHVSNEIATIQVEGRARAEISKVFTILSSQKKADQEYANKIRAKLIEEAIYHVPTGLHLKKQLARIQEEILKQEKIKHESMERSKLYSSAKIQCRNCRELLCYSSDLRKLFDCFVVVIEPSFVTKVTIEPKKEPEIQQKFIRTHKLFCKECGNAVGVKGNPINSNNELFALAYKRVRCNDSTMKSWNLIDIEKLPD